MQLQYVFILFLCYGYSCGLPVQVTVEGDPVGTEPEQVHISATG